MASSVVKRYGKAILEIASETKKIDNWISNFKDSSKIVGTHCSKVFFAAALLSNALIDN